MKYLLSSKFFEEIKVIELICSKKKNKSRFALEVSRRCGKKWAPECLSSKETTGFFFALFCDEVAPQVFYKMAVLQNSSPCLPPFHLAFKIGVQVKKLACYQIFLNSNCVDLTKSNYIKGMMKPRGHS